MIMVVLLTESAWMVASVSSSIVKNAQNNNTCAEPAATGNKSERATTPTAF